MSPVHQREFGFVLSFAARRATSLFVHYGDSAFNRNFVYKPDARCLMGCNGPFFDERLDSAGADSKEIRCLMRCEHDGFLLLPIGLSGLYQKPFVLANSYFLFL